MKKYRLFSYLNNQQGVSAVIIAICIVMLVGFVALAIDVGHLYVARNELQNAADAGALAGAHNLFNENMTSVNEDANQFAYDAAVANLADQSPVEVEDPLSNNGDVQRGHWSFTTRTFTPNDSLEVVPLLGRSEDDLDVDLNFINAVKVITRRNTTKITSFFAGIFGWKGFSGSTDAVAYIGFAGDIMTAEIDQPIAICAQSVVSEFSEPFDPSAPPGIDPCWETGGWDSCSLSCNTGTMLDSGSDKNAQDPTHNTAAWINYTKENDPGGCQTASASDMNQLVCAEELPEGLSKELEIGQGVGATGGVQQSTLTKLKNCWLDGRNYETDENGDKIQPGDPIDTDGDGIPDIAWNMLLPVVDCPGNNVSNCPKVVGVVCINMLWMTSGGTPDPSLETPFKMSAELVEEPGEDPVQKTWDITNVTENLEDNDFPLEGESFASLEEDPNTPFPSKYFEPEPFLCGGEPIEIKGYTQIPAPLSRTASPPPLAALPDQSGSNNLFAAETVQYEITKSFLNIEDPGFAPYDKDNICNEQALYEAFKHRQADAAGMGRWYSFVKYFKIVHYEGSPAALAKKSLYYLPSCTCVEQKGGSGGLNFGVLAKIPVLVE
jgi:Flp pilus assembly protein TadG